MFAIRPRTPQLPSRASLPNVEGGTASRLRLRTQPHQNDTPSSERNATAVEPPRRHTFSPRAMPHGLRPANRSSTPVQQGFQSLLAVNPVQRARKRRGSREPHERQTKRIHLEPQEYEIPHASSSALGRRPRDTTVAPHGRPAKRARSEEDPDLTEAGPSNLGARIHTPAHRYAQPPTSGGGVRYLAERFASRFSGGETGANTASSSSRADCSAAEDQPLSLSSVDLARAGNGDHSEAEQSVPASCLLTCSPPRSLRGTPSSPSRAGSCQPQYQPPSPDSVGDALLENARQMQARNENAPSTRRISRSPPRSRRGVRGVNTPPPSTPAVTPDSLFRSPSPELSYRPPPIELKDLTCVRALGSGGWGAALLTRLDREPAHPLDMPGTMFATKYVTKAMMWQQELIGEDPATKHIERSTMCDLPWNPFVCGLIAAEEDEKNLYLTLELIRGGTLRDRLYDDAPFDTETARFYIANLVLAFNHIHEHGYVHRDVKPDNILVGEDGYLCLIDLGFAKKETDDDGWDGMGTPQYKPPEAFNPRGKHNRALDWWAAGCTLYELLALEYAYGGKDEDEIGARVCNSDYKFPRDLKVDPDARDLIARLLEKDPSKRLGTNGAEEVMRHPFFKDIDWVKMRRRQLPAPWLPSRTSLALEKRLHTTEMPNPSAIPGLRMEHPPLHLRYHISLEDIGLRA